MYFPPSITTERLQLRALKKENFEHYLQFYTDAEASAFYGGPIDETATWNRLKADVGSWELLGFGVWAVYEQNTNDFIGVCGFWQGYGWPIELTWWFLPQARRKGYAVEASHAAINFAFETLGWDAVQTYMNDENIPASRLVEKIGFQYVERALFPDGLSRNIYRISANTKKPHHEI